MFITKVVLTAGLFTPENVTMIIALIACNAPETSETTKVTTDDKKQITLLADAFDNAMYANSTGLTIVNHGLITSNSEVIATVRSLTWSIDTYSANESHWNTCGVLPDQLQLTMRYGNEFGGLYAESWSFESDDYQPCDARPDAPLGYVTAWIFVDVNNENEAEIALNAELDYVAPNEGHTLRASLIDGYWESNEDPDAYGYIGGGPAEGDTIAFVSAD